MSLVQNKAEHLISLYGTQSFFLPGLCVELRKPWFTANVPAPTGWYKVGVYKARSNLLFSRAIAERGRGQVWNWVMAGSCEFPTLTKTTIESPIAECI